MNSWKSLSEIYTEGVVKGEGDRSPDIADIYSKEVLHEANITITYNDNRSPQEINISDERAEQLAQIAADVSPARNQVLYKLEGKWVGQRFDQKQIESLDAHARKISDKGRLRSRIEKIAKSSYIFKPDQLVGGFDRTIDLIEDFLQRSAIKTLEVNGGLIDEGSINRKVSDILKAIESKDLQRDFISKVEANAVGGGFNLWKISENMGKTSGIVFDPLDGDLILRPAGDEAATRGAAGPGEALLAFLYGGTKPKGAGDILLDNEEGHTIELKKNRGRIGKGIKSSDIKKIEELVVGEDINKKQVQDYISRTSGVSDQFYSYPKDLDIKDFINPFKKEIPNSIPDDERYISASDIINLYNYAKKEGKNDVADKIRNTYFNSNILKKQNELVFKGEAPGPDITPYKGAYKAGAEENINEMKLVDFYNKYSGVTKGDKSVGISTLESDITVSEALQRAPGNNPREKIGNLIGVWHLKHYMTHIQPFTWLVVYEVDGSAGVISYDAIVREDPLELLAKIGNANMKFGIRSDKDGFDIQLK